MDENSRVWAALITGCLALIGTIYTTVLNYLNRKDQDRFKAATDKELTLLKDSLAEESAERSAKRDYKYEARKRLYGECEPLIFQLAERSESFVHRVCSLARSCRLGELREDGQGWLQDKSYYLASTVYNLLAPLAVFRLIQKRLTLVDLSVDPRVEIEYSLAKHLYYALTDDFDLSRCEPAIDYEPNERGWADLRIKDPAKHWRQGLPVGLLDIAVDSLITKEDGELRLKNFGEFELEFYQDLQIDSTGQSPAVQGEKRAVLVADIFLGFHPRTRPVLWRILVAQAHLCEGLKRISRSSARAPKFELGSLIIPAERRGDYDWRRESQDASDGIVLDEPFRVAEQYLRQRFEGRDAPDPARVPNSRTARTSA